MTVAIAMKTPWIKKLCPNGIIFGKNAQGIVRTADGRILLSSVSEKAQPELANSLICHFTKPNAVDARRALPKPVCTGFKKKIRRVGH